MTGWPSVTVVVPANQHPAELRRALGSILEQDYAGHLTCVVVFDVTEPFDLSDAEPSSGRRTLVVTRNTRTAGSAGSRNTGVDISFGDLIGFCDEDDEWLSGKLRAQVEALYADGGASVVLSGFETWREGVRTPHVPGSIAITDRDLCRTGMAGIHASTLLVDREAYEGVIGPFDEACPAGLGGDYEWLLRASRQAPLVVVRDPLVRVRVEDPADPEELWQIVPFGLQYLMDAHPELRRCRANLSRMEGDVAFGYAVLGRSRDARRWALRSIRHRPGELRAYRALMIGAGLVRPATVRRWASRVERAV